MKLFVFGDTHGATEFSELLEPARDADALFCIGDVADFGFDIDSVVAGLARLADEAGKPLIITHGNHEARDLERAVAGFDQLVYVHERVHLQDGLRVFGFGGGGFRREEPEVEAFFRSAYDEHGSSDDLHVWLFHGPPHDTKTDVVPGLGPTGSHTKRSLIEEFKPHLVLVGHIHEAWGSVHELNGSVIVNPGPRGVLVEVSKQ